jgi:hypothetical protein
MPAGVRAEDRKQQCLAAYADAQELRLKGALLAARARLLTCVQPGCPGPVIKDCAGWLSDVDSSLSSIVFALSDENGRDIPDGRVTANQRVVTERTDGRAVLLDPGTYNFSIDAPGFEHEQRTLAVRQSEKNRIVRVQLKVASPSERSNRERGANAETKGGSLSASRAAASGTSVLPRSALQASSDRVTTDTPGTRSWPVVTTILGGVALVGVGGFAYFGLQGLNKRDQAERCQASCRALIDAGKRDYVIADVSLGVAIASAAAAALVYFVAESRPSAKDAPEPKPEAPLPTVLAF